MTEQIPLSDSFYFALAQTESWARLIDGAHRWVDGPMHRHVGELLSSLLLATNDAATALALVGELHGDSAGYIAIVTTSGLVYADIRRFATDSADYTVEIHGFDAVDQLTIRSNHNYFDGVSEREVRHRYLELSVVFAGRHVTFRPARFDPSSLTSPDAILRAFRELRDRRSTTPHTGPRESRDLLR